MNRIVIFLCTLLNCYCLFAQNVQLVTEQTIKVTSETEFVYCFAAGDEVIFSFKEMNGKSLKELEIIEYPSNSKFSDFKTNTVNRRFTIGNKDAIYVFKLKHDAVGSRVCNIKIERVPATGTENFSTTPVWKTRVDTTYRHYTKEVVVGEQTIYEERTQRDLLRIDTTFVPLKDDNVSIPASQSRYLTVDIPDNQTSGNITKEIVSWAYWIGIGSDAIAKYNAANIPQYGMSPKIAISGYPLLANVACGGISKLQSPSSYSSNVKYSFEAFVNGQRMIYANGDTKGTTGYNNKVLQGAFSLKLYNDNILNSITVGVKIIALQLVKYWQETTYTEPVVVPIKEWKTFTEPVYKRYSVPTIEKPSK